MKKQVMLLTICTVFSFKASAQADLKQGINLHSVEYFWKEAVELYVTETEDYLESLSSTEQELKHWRLRVLQDRFETRIGGLEVILSKSNFEELAQLEKSVESRGLDSLDDSLMMRLAQLHYDRAGFDFNLKAKKLREQKNFKGAMPTPDYKKTIFYTKEIIKRFPKSTVLEHAYYLLGFCLFDENKDKQAASVYEQMLKYFPNQILSYEARWRLAEFYFEQNMFEQAAENYKFLNEHKNPFSHKAFYKLGATYYSQKNYPAAYNIFLKLYNDSAEKLGTKDAEAETLNSEALDYLAHLKLKKIKMNLEQETEAIIVQRLSEIYKQKLNEAAARNVLIEFALEHPLAKKAPLFLNDVIESFEYDNLAAQAQKMRSLFLEKYKPSSAFWKNWSNDVSATVEIQDLYESVLLSSAHYFADLARKNIKGDFYEKAVLHYQQFITDYPVSPLKNQAKYELAELQYFAGYYSDAAATYMDMTVDSESEEYKEEAAYGYFLSEMKRLKYDPSFTNKIQPDLDQKGNLKPASDISLDERRFFDAADFYTKNVIKGFRRQKIFYKKAELLFKHNQFNESRMQLEQILKEQELSSIAPRALKLLEETYNLQGDWKNVLETKKAQIEIARRQAFDLSQTEEIFKTKNTVLSQAWKDEKRNELKVSAEGYEYFSVKYSKAPEVPAALLRAGLLYRNLGQIKESNRLLFRLVKDYPYSHHVPQAQFLISSNYESMLRFDDAIKGFMNIFKNFAKKEIGLQALLNAASLQYAMGDYIGAGNKYQTYARILNDDATLLTAAEVYKKANDKALALKIYKEFAKGKHGPSLAIEAYLNMAELTSNYEAKLNYCKTIKDILQNNETAKYASSQHAMTGCMYFKSKPYAQKVNIEKLKINWGNLSKVYDYIMQADDIVWLKEVVSDLRQLYERTQYEPVAAKINEINNKLSENKIDTIDVSYFKYKSADAESIQVRWPVESSLTRVAYDQKKWDELIKNAQIELTAKPQSYLYIATARGFAEKDEWGNAKDSLKKCTDQLQDAVCSAYLSLLDKKHKVLSTNYEPEDEALIILVSALQQARQGKDPSKLFEQAASLQAQLVDIYRYYAMYLSEKKNYELAKTVLNAGIRNTQGDERLLVQKGYLALETRNRELSLAVANEMKYYDASTDDALIYQALYAYIKNNTALSKKYLSQVSKSKKNNYLYVTQIINQAQGERLPASGDKK